MGVMNILSTLKNTNAKVENEEQSSIPSPAVSSISSVDSGSLLIHGHQLKAVHKKKQVSWATGRKHVSTRLTNIIWSGLFLMVIIATVIVVATLAENIRRTLWNKVSYTDEDSALQPVPNSVDDLYPKTDPEVEEKVCIHRRIIWEHGSQSSEIIHDMSSKWSAIVDHDEGRCLIFDLHNSRHNGCPVTYPWDMDLHVGIPACRGPLAVIAPIRKIMHHICNEPQVNLTVTGEVISTQCSNHRILQVDKVIIQYFDRNFRRVARSVLKKRQSDAKNTITPSIVSATVVSIEARPDAIDVFNSEKKHLRTSTVSTTKTSMQDFNNGRQTVMSSSKEAAEDVFSRSALFSKANHKQPAAPTTISAKKHFRDVIPIVVNKITHSKLNRVLADNVKQPSERRLFGENGGLPEKSDYWEVIYNYVDDEGNLFRADKFNEIKLGRK